jgi:pimeloyl-ACP methyl ester carboxylesterase
MFHSQAFVDRLNRTEGSRATGMDTGHWIMLDNPDEVNSGIQNWLEGR